MDRNIDERLRKPRRAKGTPFYQTRNYYTLGLLAVAGVSWYFFEKIPAVRRLRSELLTTDRYDSSPEVREHLQSMRVGFTDPDLRHIVDKYLARKEQKEKFGDQYEKEPKEQPWYSKLYQTHTFPKTSTKTETISRFFAKVENDQSVYKEAITEIKKEERSRRSDADFVSPEPVKKLAKIFVDAEHRNDKKRLRTTRASKKTPSNNEEKKLIEIAKTSDVNMEHLQMAMALSRSVEPVKEHDEDESPYPSTQQITEKARMDIFAFRIKSKEKDVPAKTSHDNNKNKKKSKFRYTTPTLCLRTKEDRERLINEKIARILVPFNDNHENVTKESLKPFSYILQQNYNEQREYFNRSQQVDKQIEHYYVKGIDVDWSETVCGSLLKNWDLIAGREKSPVREPHANTNQQNDNILVEDQKENVLSDDNCKETQGNVDIVILNKDNEVSDLNLIRNTSMATSCSSNFSSVSQHCRNTLRTARCESPDLFASSSDEDDVDDNVFEHASPKSTTQTKILDVDQEHEVSGNSSLIISLTNGYSPRDPGNVKAENLASTSRLSHLINANETDNQTFKPIVEHEKADDVIIQENKEHSGLLVISDCEEQIGIETVQAKQSNEKFKMENYGSASLASNLNTNADVTSESDNKDFDSDDVYEIDDKGICYYESFCDFEDSDKNSTSEQENVSVADSSKLKDSDNNERQRSRPSSRSKSEATKFDDSVEVGNEKLYISKIHNDTQSGLNVTDYVHALLNSDSFVDDLKSVNIENYFDQTKIHLDNQVQSPVIKMSQKMVSAIADDNIQLEKVENDDDVIDLSQEVDVIETVDEAIRRNTTEELNDLNSAILDTSGNEMDDFIDLSQRSDDSDSEINSVSTAMNIYVESPKQNESIGVGVSNKNKVSSFQKRTSSSSLDSNRSSEESICVSDEELNYSCLNASHVQHTPLRMSVVTKKSKFAISDSENDDDDGDEETNEVFEGSINVDELLARLKAKKGEVVIDLDNSEDELVHEEGEQEEEDNELQEALRISLEEVEQQQITVQNDIQELAEKIDHDHMENVSVTPKRKSFNQQLTCNDEPDEFDLMVDCNQPTSVFNITKTKILQHPRVQELISTDNRSPKQIVLKTPTKIKTGNNNTFLFEDTFANLLEQTNVLNNIENLEKNELKITSTSTPERVVQNGNDDVPITPGTPQDGIYVKTMNITPMPIYDQMTTPEIHQELDRIGVKALKRRRGVQVLKHVYNSMHLNLEQQDISQVDVDEFRRPAKKRKKLDYNDLDEQIANCLRTDISNQQGTIDINNQISTCEQVDEMIFERKQSKRIASCAMPFHIAWHNFLCVNRNIWENVLLYEPLQVEVLYAMFKELGFKYHIQDMISFFDKKCITIRIKQNN